MNMRIDFRKLAGWLALGSMLAVAGLIPLSANAQSQNQLRPTQQKTDDAVTLAETGSADATVPVSPNSPAPSAGSYSWTGAYIGGHVGYGWGRANTDFTPLPSSAQFINMRPTTLSPDPSGFNGGVQGGYDWQMGSFVVGGEADFSWSRMKGTAILTPIIQDNGTPFPGTGFLTTHQDTKWFGTVRPRAGIAFNKLLVYGTGGLAYGHVNYSANADFRPGGTIQYPASFSKTKAGWTVGVGGELGINQHWSLKAEYLYYDLGSESFTANPVPANPPFLVAYKWETKAHTFNSGINYRF